MRNRDLVESTAAFEAIMNTSTKGTLGFLIISAFKRVNQHLQDLDAARVRILQQHYVKGPDGAPVPARDAEGRVIVGKFELTDEMECRREIQSLLELEVGHMLQITKIPRNMCGDLVIEPRHLMALEWLFE